MARDAHATVSTQDLTIGYAPDKPVAGPINTALGPGIHVLLGRNGAGKTTLMRTLCGIIPPLQGTCFLEGHPTTDGAPVRSRIGYLGHRSALAERLSVADNLSFWRSVLASYPGISPLPEATLTELYDLGPLMTTMVGKLSRGQRQRVDLARLAMGHPSLIILDEPLTGLDPIYAAQVRGSLREWASTGTVLYSTHSVPEALAVSDHYLILHGARLSERAQGAEPVGEPEILALMEANS